MRLPAVLLLPLTLTAQPPAAERTTFELATRMSQLMESTAVAVPGLIGASEPIRQLATGTLPSLKGGSGNLVFVWRFINQTKAYLALSESYPTPQLPLTADRQFAELREDLVSLRQRFEAGLESQNEASAAGAADPADLHRYSEANTKLPPPGTIPRVVFLGDATTDAWPLNEYFTGRDFINRGIAGQTTLQMLGRFQQDVVAIRARAVVILGGADDLVRGISPGAIEDALNMMGDLAKAHGIKPIFASLLPQGTRVPEINQWLRSYCTRESFAYLDYISVLADTGGRLSIELSDDGLHPNAKGYKVMAPVALEAINRALAVTNPKPPAPQPHKLFGLPIIK